MIKTIFIFNKNIYITKYKCTLKIDTKVTIQGEVCYISNITKTDELVTINLQRNNTFKQINN